MSPAIVGIGAVTALGEGRESLRGALRGEIEPRIEPNPVALPEGEVALPVYTADPAGLKRFIKPRLTRRLDRLSRMALLAAELAAEDAGPDPSADPTRIGVVFGTAYGPLGAAFDFHFGVEDYGDGCASPITFAASVHNSPASQISILMGIAGPGHTVTTFGQTLDGVLSTARAWLEAGAVDYVIAGLGDEYVPALGYSFVRGSAGGAVPEAIAPLDFERCSGLPGEGCVALVLAADGAPGARARIVSVESGRIDRDIPALDASDVLIVAASGRAGEGAAYRRLLEQCGEKPAVTAFSPYYGSTPAGCGVDLALAAVGLDEGLIAGAEGARIGCLSCSEDGRYTLIRLERA